MDICKYCDSQTTYMQSINNKKEPNVKNGVKNYPKQNEMFQYSDEVMDSDPFEKAPPKSS